MARKAKLDQWAGAPLGVRRARRALPFRGKSGYLAPSMRLSPWALSTLLLSARAAYAEEICSGKDSGLGCFDAAPLPGPAEPSPFRWFARGSVLSLGDFAGTFVLRHLNSPAELVVASPDPAGKRVPVVRNSTQVHARFAVGFGGGVDLTLTTKVAVDQSGAGPEAMSTQAPAPLGRTALGDPRLSLRKSLPPLSFDAKWSVRLELSAPLGDERGFAGNRSFAGAGALNVYRGFGLISLVGDVGLEVSRSTRFGDVNLGSHLFLGLGVDAAPLDSDILHASLEVLLRPVLVDAPRPSDATAHADWVMPTDYLLSVSSRPLSSDLWFSLAAGGGLPLSRRDHGDARMDAWFVAPTSPRWQLLASVAVRN